MLPHSNARGGRAPLALCVPCGCSNPTECVAAQGCFDRCKVKYQSETASATGYDGTLYVYPTQPLGRKCAEGCASLSPPVDENLFCSQANGQNRVQKRPCPSGSKGDTKEEQEATAFGCEWWSMGGH